MKLLQKSVFIFSLVTFSFYPIKGFAQADISMATHWFNRATYNPASIVHPGYIYLFSNVRKQWAGIDGSPTVCNVQASEYFDDLHSAFGISLVNDAIGVTQSLNPMLTYAYRLGRDNDWWISLGMSAGVFFRSTNEALFEAAVINDPALYTNLENTFSPDVNVGAEFQSTYFVFGLSSTHLFSIGKTENIFLNSNHRYGYAIYKNTDSELLNYNFGLQVVNRSNLTYFEGNASLRFKHPTGLQPGPREIFDIGLTYRTSGQMTMLFGINITNNFRVGYAFEQSFTTGYSANSGHEIMLEYRIPVKRSSASNYRTLNYWYY